MGKQRPLEFMSIYMHFAISRISHCSAMQGGKFYKYCCENNFNNWQIGCLWQPIQYTRPLNAAIYNVLKDILAPLQIAYCVFSTHILRGRLFKGQ